MTAPAQWILLGVQATMAGLFLQLGRRLRAPDRRRTSLRRIEDRQGAFVAGVAAVVLGIVLMAEGDAIRVVAGLALTHPLFRTFILSGYAMTLAGLVSMNTVLAWPTDDPTAER